MLYHSTKTLLRSILRIARKPMKPGGMIGSNLLINASTRSTRWHANHISRIEKIPQMFSGRRRSGF
jgi:hypothetical protein